jgi:hypothetical protein
VEDEVLPETVEYAASSNDFFCRIFISMGLPERIKKILVPEPVILRRVAGRMRGTMSLFMELTFTSDSAS